MLSIQASNCRTPSQTDVFRAAAFTSREGACETPAPVVHIVEIDGDGQLLCGWVRDAGLGARKHADLDDFVDSEMLDGSSCLVVDARIACRAQGGLGAFLQRVSARCPIVITAEGADVPTAVLAMKTGAVDFVEKPFRESDILGAVDAALQKDGERRAVAARAMDVSRRYATLSHRERQVMALVTAGLLNKQVAGDLGVSEITVKAHRGAAMRKMAARSLADLVRMADALGDLLNDAPQPMMRAA